MFEVALILGLYLAVLAIVAWAWWARPAPEGYYLSGGLAIINMGLLVMSSASVSQEGVSLLGGVAYVMGLASQILLLATLGRRLHKIFASHLRGQDQQAGRMPRVEIGRFSKVIILAFAGLGSILVVLMILSRRIVFLQPGETVNFYIMLGGIAILVALVWWSWFLAKKRGGPAASRDG